MADFTGINGTIIIPVTVPILGTADNTANIAANTTVTGTLGAALGPGVISIGPGAVVNNSGTVNGDGVVGAALTTALGAAATLAGLALPALPTTTDGVSLLLGGTVNNGNAITGADNGVDILGGDGVVVNTGTITGTAAAGAALAGGNISNTGPNATITGATVGADIGGALGTPSNVTNQGTISGTGAGSTGLRVAAGLVNNSYQAGAGAPNTALISGLVNGLVSAGDTTLDNLGTIRGGTGVGVQLTTPEAITNGGTVSGGTAGLVNLGLGALNNSGTITGTNGVGARLAGDLDNLGGTISGTTNGVEETGAGTLTNEANGTIKGVVNGVLQSVGVGNVVNAGTIAAGGTNGTGVNLLGGGTVNTTGTISGTDGTGAVGGVAVKLGGTANRLVLGAGAILNGAAQAAGTGNTLEVAANATQTLADLGTTFAGFDNTALDAGSTTEITGAVTQTGTIALGDGAALKLDGAVAPGATVDLGGGRATLTLADPAAFAGQIANLGADDVLDLTGLAAGTTVAVQPGVGLTVTGPNGAATTLNVALPVDATLQLDPSGTGISVGVGLGGTGTTITVGGGTGTNPGGGTGTNPGGGTGTNPGGGAGTNPGGGTGTNPGGGTGTNPGGGTGTNPGGGTGTNPGGGAGTNPGGTITAGGGTTTSTDPTTGGTTVTTTTPAGSTTTQILPPGSSVSQDPNTGDVISIDPNATFVGRGAFEVTGHVAAASGVKTVTISAVVDGAAPTVLGTASVAADGSYSFLDRVGAHLQGFITATETDGLGISNGVQSPYSLQAGLRGVGHAAEQDQYTPDGSAEVALTSYKRDGSSRVDVRDAGQTLQSNFFDTFNNHGAPDNTFVFNAGHGLDTVNLFRANGPDHDTISLPSADFQNMAAVMSNTQDAAGGALIVNPNTGDAIKLTGVSKAELKANPSDFAFHA